MRQQESGVLLNVDMMMKVMRTDTHGSPNDGGDPQVHPKHLPTGNEK
jgi:hypothetical protein